MAKENRKIHHIFETRDGTWVIRYGRAVMEQNGAPLHFDTRDDAVRMAHKLGFFVNLDNTLRPLDPVSDLNGLDDAGQGRKITVHPVLVNKPHAWTGDKVWVFTYDGREFRFIGKPQYYKTRTEAVQAALEAGWGVDEDNVLDLIGGEP